jgi:hypothetical protein
MIGWPAAWLRTCSPSIMARTSVRVHDVKAMPMPCAGGWHDGPHTIRDKKTRTMTRKYFGTDGVRGKVGEFPITPDFVMKLGWAAGKVLSKTGTRRC